MRAPHLTVKFTTLLVLTLSSCSTLVGNVKPVDEKSSGYHITDPAPESCKKLYPTSLFS